MYRALLLSAVILQGCQSRQDADSAADTVSKAVADTASTARADTAATSGANIAMVPPTAFAKMVSQMMVSMEAHMRVMDTASASTVQARMPRHNQMAENMISRMNEEVRRMNIPTDATWPATVDSVRQDLSRLQAMTTGTDMKGLLPAHLARMRWLIQMQQTMTGKTPS